MKALYPFFIAFTIIFLAELGDKTQLLVLSFASKSKTRNILLGIAIGTFFSHGLAIIFGGSIGALQNKAVLFVLKCITYFTFLVIGLLGFFPKRERENNKDNKLIKKLGNSSLNYIFIVAIAIMVGELGDKTFLASIGLGLEYPHYKLSLIAGCILGMIVSNSIAILFGRFIEKKVPEKHIEIVSSLIFIAFGTIGLYMLIA